MLIMFRVENYRSFDEVQEILMVAGSVKNHHRHVVTVHGKKVLTASAIFGANASGKTNLVRAMADSQAKIVGGIPIAAEAWNRNSEANRELPTGFEYVFTTPSAVLAYGFEVMLETGEVRTEWLHDMTEGDTEVFHREGRDVRSYRDQDPVLRSKLDVVASMLRDKSGDLLLPLLSRMETEADQLFESSREAMSWFAHNLVVVSANSNAPVVNYDGRDDMVRGAMASYATGITGIGYERLNFLPPEIPSAFLKQIEPDLMKGAVGTLRDPQGYMKLTYSDGIVAERTVFFHNGKRFDFNEESDGTKRLFDLLPVIERNNLSDVTFVIDELNRSLHPQLTRKFVTDFQKIAQGSRRQLIFTTHEAMLLDLDILRRDEFWFAERTRRGDTRLYSLEKFRERADRKVLNSYMDGRYGAIPTFKELYPDLE